VVDGRHLVQYNPAFRWTPLRQLVRANFCFWGSRPWILEFCPRAKAASKRVLKASESLYRKKRNSILEDLTQSWLLIHICRWMNGCWELIIYRRDAIPSWQELRLRLPPKALSDISKRVTVWTSIPKPPLFVRSSTTHWTAAEFSRKHAIELPNVAAPHFIPQRDCPLGRSLFYWRELIDALTKNAAHVLTSRSHLLSCPCSSADRASAL